MKLAESPFYAAGGGQVADVGTIECAQRRLPRARGGRVPARRRPGARGRRRARASSSQGEPVLARVDHLRAPRDRGQPHGHPPAAGGAARAPRRARAPGRLLRRARTSCASTSATARRSASEELRDVEDRGQRVDRPERPRAPDHDDARRGQAPRRDGAVRREVRRGRAHGRGRGRATTRASSAAARTCARTAEIGPSGSSARPPARRTCGASRRVTGPAAVALLREHDRLLGEIGAELRTRPEEAPEAVRSARAGAQASWRRRSSRAPARRTAAARSTSTRSRAPAEEIAGAKVLAASGGGARREGAARRGRPRQGPARRRGDPARHGRRRRVHLVASVAPALVERGVKAGAVVKVAAEVVGGGGGGRDTMAQAGGRDPEKLDAAIEAARSAIEAALGLMRVARPGVGERRGADWHGGERCAVRVLALDYGSARCGCAVSDPTGTIVTPLETSSARPPSAGWRAARARRSSARPSASSSGCRCRSTAATPSRRARRARSPSALRAVSGARCRWSCTTSASPRGWPSACRGRERRARTPARPPTCSRAGSRRDRVRVPGLGTRRSITAGARTDRRGARTRSTGARTRRRARGRARPASRAAGSSAGRPATARRAEPARRPCRAASRRPSSRRAERAAASTAERERPPPPVEPEPVGAEPVEPVRGHRRIAAAVLEPPDDRREPPVPVSPCAEQPLPIGAEPHRSSPCRRRRAASSPAA